MNLKLRPAAFAIGRLRARPGSQICLSINRAEGNLEIHVPLRVAHSNFADVLSAVVLIVEGLDACWETRAVEMPEGLRLGPVVVFLFPNARRQGVSDETDEIPK